MGRQILFVSTESAKICQLALEFFFLLAESFRQFDGAINFVFEMRELFQSGKRNH